MLNIILYVKYIKEKSTKFNERNINLTHYDRDESIT